jgi:hypothetical protein
MSHFYGCIPASMRKTPATARASKNTGLTVQAASWGGAVETRLYHDEDTGKDMFVVYQIPWHGRGVSKELARGVVGE